MSGGIEIEKLTDAEIDARGIRQWPIWEKEASTFPWHYDDRERCLILEGRVRVEPEGGEPVDIEAGDFVTFPRGMSCTWTISVPLRKHYSFG